MSPDSASVANTRSDPLYSALEERILDRDQKGASEVYYKLAKSGRPLTEMLREAVRNLAGGEAALSEAAKDELTARMSAFLHDPALAWLVGLSADAVAAELAAEAHAVST